MLRDNIDYDLGGSYEIPPKESAPYPGKINHVTGSLKEATMPYTDGPLTNMAEGSTRRENGLGRTFEDYSFLLDKLDKKIGVLEETISPILLPADPANVGEKEVDRVRSSATQLLDEKNARLNRLIECIDNIISRVDL